MKNDVNNKYLLSDFYAQSIAVNIYMYFLI